MEITKEDIEAFNQWCKDGKNNPYKNFPIGRTGKLGPYMVALFLVEYKGLKYDDALSYELNNIWLKAIEKDWLNSFNFNFYGNKY